MKKVFSLILIGLLLFSNIISNVYAADFDIVIANQVLSRIENIENKDLNLNDYYILYDIEFNPNYLLLEFNQGYAIASRENGIISEYNLNVDANPYSEFDSNDVWVYGGPKNYTTMNKTSPYIINSSSLTCKSEELIQKNRAFLEITNDEIQTYTSRATYTGISSSRMQRYSSGKWINSKSNYPTSEGYSSGGICGSIVAAVLLAYNDDYIDDTTVASIVRARNSTAPGQLIELMFDYIDAKHPNGTIPTHVSSGIDSYINDYVPSLAGKYFAHYSAFTTFAKAKTVINAGHPIAIGLLDLWGSEYGDHWVVAYQYYDASGTSNDMYKCVDNHGEYDAAIHVSWSEGYVYLNY